MDEKKIAILEALQELEDPSKTDIAEKIGESKQNICKNHLPTLQKKGLIEIDDENWIHIVRITGDGKDKIIEEKSGTASPKKVDKISGQDHRFIHRFVVGFPVQNSSMLKDDWRERVVEEVDRSVNYVDEFDEYRFSVDRWQFRVSGDFVYVKLRNEVRGEHYRKVKDDAIEEAVEGARFFQELDEIPIVLDEAPASFRVAEQHIGSSGDNLVHAFVKYVDEKTEHNVSNWRCYGEEGSSDRELLIWADKSSGELHEESGNGGNPSGSRERAEDVQAFTEEITEGMVSRPDQTRELIYNGVERIENNSREVEDVRSEVRDNSDVLDELSKVVSEIHASRKSEKGTRDALIELVRSNQQTMQSNQELIERQEEMIEKQSEVIESLQEEISDLRKSKSMEKRVRERYEKHPDFSSVHEHSSEGNNSLYVWDHRNGSPEYRKVLDEGARDMIKEKPVQVINNG
jgi:hypothetical protein